MTTEAVSNQHYVPAIIETGRIVNVNINDWTVDVVSEQGDKKFFDIQVMSPYLHYVNGDGVYSMPEVGAMCWVCKPSDGTFSSAFVLGYQGIHNEAEDSFRSGRQSLNPGDLMMRTRDENFVILRRGGVVQIGATPLSQRIYIPIGNMIRDFAENYELHTLAGDMTFTTERTEESTSGDVMTTFRLNVKDKANTAEPVVTMSVGSHGEDNPTKLQLCVRESGESGAETKITVTLSKDGDVAWDIKRDFSMTVGGNYDLTVKGDKSVSVTGNDTTTVTGDILTESKKAGTWKTALEAKIEAGTDVRLKAQARALVEALTIHLGGESAAEPVIKGTQWMTFMTTMLTFLSQMTCPTAQILTGAPAPVLATGVPGGVPQFTALQAQLPSLVSTKTFTS